MEPLKITFFHDVLCPLCLPMSRRLRRVLSRFPDSITVEHRCYPLVPYPEDLQRKFGSYAAAKREFLQLWEEVSRLPDAQDIQPERMWKRTFRFPHSLPALRCCKAVERQLGMEGHWEIFDLLQNALFVAAENVASFRVLQKYARQCNVDMKRWREDFFDDRIVEDIFQDLHSAHHLGIFGIPAFLFNSQFLLQGEVPEEVLYDEIQQLRAMGNSLCAAAKR